MGRYLTGQSQTKELQSQIYHGKRLKEFLTQYPHNKSETYDYMIEPELQQYNPYEGFIVQFDRIYGLPQNFNKIKLFYDIQLKGLFTKPSKETSSHQTQNYSYKHKKCEINEKDLFVNVNQDPSIIIFVEIWAEVINQQKNKLYENPVQKMVGWTMVECFKCSDRQLNNGNFKLPIYNPQLDPLSLIKYGLPAIFEAHLFLRIGYKNQQMMQIKMQDIDHILFITPDFHKRPYSQQYDKQFNQNFTVWNSNVENFIEDLDSFMQRAKKEQIKELNNIINMQYIQQSMEKQHQTNKMSQKIGNVIPYEFEDTNLNQSNKYAIQKFNEKLLSQWAFNQQENNKDNYKQKYNYNQNGQNNSYEQINQVNEDEIIVFVSKLVNIQNSNLEGKLIGCFWALLNDKGIEEHQFGGPIVNKQQKLTKIKNGEALFNSVESLKLTKIELQELMKQNGNYNYYLLIKLCSRILEKNILLGQKQNGEYGFIIIPLIQFNKITQKSEFKLGQYNLKIWYPSSNLSQQCRKMPERLKIQVIEKKQFKLFNNDMIDLSVDITNQQFQIRENQIQDEQFVVKISQISNTVGLNKDQVQGQIILYCNNQIVKDKMCQLCSYKFNTNYIENDVLDINHTQNILVDHLKLYQDYYNTQNPNIKLIFYFRFKNGQPLFWYSHNLFKSNGILNSGRFQEKLFKCKKYMYF